MVHGDRRAPIAIAIPRIWCLACRLALVSVLFAQFLAAQEVNVGDEVNPKVDDRSQVLALIGRFVLMKSVEKKEVLLDQGKMHVKLFTEEDLEKASGSLVFGGKPTAYIMLEEMADNDVFNACLPIVIDILVSNQPEKVPGGTAFTLTYKSYELVRVSEDKIVTNSAENLATEDRANIIALLKEKLKD